MRKAVVSALACVAFGGAVVNASTLLGPKGSFSSFLTSLKYDPSTACHKPMRPYSDDQFAREKYLSEGRRYLDCLETAARSDISYAEAVVQEGYQMATEKFLAEVRRGY